MGEDKIVLDRKSFEALAVDTRVRILKSLKARRKTLSEISKEQGMSVSGVKEHLETLEGVGLIEKKDDGHKWKYYELTKKGSDIVAPRELRVWILLSISTIALVASMMALFSPPAVMAEAPISPELQDVSPQEPPLMMAAAYSADANATGGAEAAGGAARSLAADGNGLPPEAKAAAAEAAGGEARQDAVAQKPDLTMPMAVGAVSAITLLACAGILVKNRMRPASP
jgi:DNA-binding transcriptional ArsR family regulator